jgi:hypothetical protein
LYLGNSALNFNGVGSKDYQSDNQLFESIFCLKNNSSYYTFFAAQIMDPVVNISAVQFTNSLIFYENFHSNIIQQNSIHYHQKTKFNKLTHPKNYSIPQNIPAKPSTKNCNRLLDWTFRIHFSKKFNEVNRKHADEK